MKNHNKRSAFSRVDDALAGPSLPCWKHSALAAALMACAGLYSPIASALTLGTITVQSALGEPLRAEIDLPQITPAEADSLRASTASPDMFRAQGMEYSSTASQMRLELKRRSDGRMVLALTGNRPVNEPFVDLVIDARWSAGQVTRSYTMLFDPPAPRRSQAAAAVVAPSLSAPASSVAVPPNRRRAVPVEDSSTAASGSNESSDRNAGSSASQRRAAAAPRASTSQASADDTVRVTPGDTAGRIANARRQQGVSLDQMLVAMSRANPSAFVQGNVNRLKAGSVLQIPSQDEALATPAGQARQLIAVQSRDFNAFRRRLAGAAPDAEQAGAQRSARGSVQTRTEDSSATALVPDKLTLSKGAMQGKKTSEEMLAQRKQGNEASARAQELARNIAELNQLNAASAASGANVASSADTTTAATTPGLAVPNPGLAALAEPAPAPVLPAVAGQQDTTPPPDTAEAPVATSATLASPAPAPAPAAAAVPAPTPVPEPGGFVQDLMEQPALPLAAVALLLLLGYGGYRAVQRRRSSSHVAIDSSFVDSRVHPDSFFGATGGQRVDTASADSSMGGPSLSYSPSQLDVGGEVDPVAEADVYLAYGRDLQAEEILREAARQQPQRVAIAVKLGEIYAKRLDGRALEVVARDVQRLTKGHGAEWEHMVELGLQLDPNNALYRSDNLPSAAVNPGGTVALGAAGAMLAAAPAQEPAAVLPLDLDLNLDFDMQDDAIAHAHAEDLQRGNAPGSPVPATTVAGDEDWDALEDLVAFNAAIAAPAQPPAPHGAQLHLPANAAADLDLDMDMDLDIDMDLGETRDRLGNTPKAQIDDGLHSGPDNLGMDLNWEQGPSLSGIAANPAAPTGYAGAEIGSADEQPDAFALNFDLPELNASAVQGGADGTDEISASKEGFVSTESQLLDFDFDSLSLDLDTPELTGQDGRVDTLDSSAYLPDRAVEGDPLATKLALAQEFHAIGDSEGARTLTEEVISESSGALRQRAQNLLAELD